MHIGAAARGGGLRGIVYSNRPVERIGRGKKLKQSGVDVESKIALTPTCIPVGLLGGDLQAISSVALVDLKVRHEPLLGIVSFGWHFSGLPMCIARPLAVNYFSTQQPATLHLNVAGWHAAAFIKQGG